MKKTAKHCGFFFPFFLSFTAYEGKMLECKGDRRKGTKSTLHNKPTLLACSTAYSMAAGKRNKKGYVQPL